MAIDPICGMTVDPATALAAERDGETIYFCSEHCRQKFLAGDTTPVMHDHAAQHGGPPLLSIQPQRKTAPTGQEPGCCHGHDSSTPSVHTKAPSTRFIAGRGAQYFCPMCEGVESDRPGDCPKCGMAL
jgi:Cu+-exporting ATPase